jgi:hypothetical protein
MTSWIETLSRDPANIMPALPGFGWHNDGFIYDGTLFAPTGALPALSVEPEISSLYSVSGNRTAWDDAVGMVLSRGNVGLNAILASTLAGPLVPFTAEDGLWLHAISPPGGSKTTANRVAVAFWGAKTSKLGKEDTAYSVQKKMETVRNITVFHDDLQVTADNAADVSKFAMMITSGQGRGRLTQDAKQRPIGYWSTMYSSNGNVSVRDAFVEYSRKTQAAHTRVFEIAVPPLGQSGALPMGTAMQLINKVDNNHGHAGRVYSAYLGANRAAVEDMVKKTVDAISSTYNCTSDERFWVCTMAVLLVGAALARHLKLVPFSDAAMAALRDYLAAALQGNRTEMAAEHSEATPVAVANHINEYLSACLGEFGCLMTQPGKPPTPYTAGRHPTNMMIEVNRITGFIWFQRSHFRSWLQKQRLAQGSILKQLKALGAQDVERRLFVDSNYKMASTKLIGIALDNPHFPGLPR